MAKKILLLGYTGKMGVACREVFKADYELDCKNSGDFDAGDFERTQVVVEQSSPDIVINTVAFLGIDPSENEPNRAFRLNTLYPEVLAKLSRELGFLLIHFSTDAVFNDEKGDYYIESDCPAPLNLYGLTKFGGDCMVRSHAENYYIIRIPVLFGESTKNDQFVEKMLQRVRQGQTTLKISDDIISSPSYSLDVARKIKRIVKDDLPPGLYHLANEGKASLYDLMAEVVKNLGLDVSVERGSYNDFPFVGIKNTCTPIRSEKIDASRPWQEAVSEYCDKIKCEVYKE